MKQLVFIDKGKDGKDRIFTTSKTGKMLFPHKNLKIEFEPITVIDDFKVEYEKENYGFFSGKKVDVCLPEPKDLVAIYREIFEFMEIMPRTYVFAASSFYMLCNDTINVLITQEVDSGEILMVKEEMGSSETRSGKNPQYYSIYNGMTSLGKENISIDEFILKIALSRDTALIQSQKASMALTANRIFSYQKREDYVFTYYDKCIVRLEKDFELFKIYYISLNGAVDTVNISHDTLYDIITRKLITIANPNEYKEAVDKCFDEGFCKVVDSSFYPREDVCDIYKSITGRHLGISNDMFGKIDGYSSVPIYVLNIDMYDTIKKIHSEDELKKLAQVSKDTIKKIDSDIKMLGKNMSKQSLSEIVKLNYKSAITVAI